MIADQEINGNQVEQLRSSLRRRIDDSKKEDTIEITTNESSTEKKLNTISIAIKQHRSKIRIALLLVLNVLVITYFGFATSFFIDKENTCITTCGIKWCDGYGLLIILFALLYIGLVYYKLVKPLWKRTLHQAVSKLMNDIQKNAKTVLILQIAAVIVIAGGLIIYTAFDARNDAGRLRSLVGMVALLLISFLISKHRTKINYRTVIFGVLFQILLGIFCIRWDVGRRIFSCMGEKVTQFLGYAQVGSSFVFGELTTNGIFAFSVMTVIFFFSLCISVAYFYGAMQFVIEKLGWLLQVLLGTTVIESVTVAANIFLGMSESPFVIRPYIKDLTDSEMHAVMSSGYATVSGTVLAAYISFGADPAHLITASVMAAPATLAFTKLIYPETEESKTSSSNIKMEKSEDATVLEAATNGANQALPVVLGVIGNLIAFVSFIAFANALMTYFGSLVGYEGITLEFIFGKIFTPLAWAMGVDWAECEYVGQLIGLKSIVNEFVAFERLGRFKEENLISSRSAAIATYAICGFANPSSLGILIGALGALCPEKKGAIIKVAVRALICGSIVCFMTASIAGLLMTEDIYSDIGGNKLHITSLLGNKTIY